MNEFSCFVVVFAVHFYGFEKRERGAYGVTYILTNTYACTPTYTHTRSHTHTHVCIHARKHSLVLDKHT